MAKQIEIRVPRYMAVEDAANELNAYLLGARGRRNHDGSLGPFLDRHTHGESKWQLDDSNDYWLHFDAEGYVRLTYRYSYEKATALAALFHAMHAD